MAYADYAFYTGTYKGGAIAQSDFDRLALRASSKIDQLTFDRADVIVVAGLNTATINKIRMATCAVAEEMKHMEESGGALSSERIGNSSVTYLSTKSEHARLVDAAKLYLWNADLMYRGFADGELSEDHDAD